MLAIGAGFAYTNLLNGTPITLLQVQLPPPTIQPGLMVRFTAVGTLINNSGAIKTAGAQLAMNGTTLINANTLGPLPLATSANPRVWRSVAYFYDNPLLQKGYKATPVQSSIEPVGRPSRIEPTPSTFNFSGFIEQFATAANAPSGTFTSGALDTAACGMASSVVTSAYNYQTNQTLTLTFAIDGQAGIQIQLLYVIAEAV